MPARMLAFGVAVVLFAGLASAEDPSVSPAAGTRVRVAILPMVVNTVGEQAYLRSGLADMLASRLGRNARLGVIRIEDEALATTDPRRAAAIALERNARYVVFGSFTQFGEGASLDVQCVEARPYEEDEDPAARRVFIQSGTVGEIIPKLDATAGKIGLFMAAAPEPADAGAPAVAAAPEAAPAAPPVANEAAFEDLRRRLETIEDYLFAGGEEHTAEALSEEPPTQASPLR